MKITEEILWDYADNFLSLTERSAVEAALANDPDARALWATIQGMHSSMQQQSLSNAPLGLSYKILQAWEQEQAESTDFQFNAKPLYLIMSFVVLSFLGLLWVVIPTLQPTPISYTFELPTRQINLIFQFTLAVMLIMALDRWRYWQMNRLQS